MMLPPPFVLAAGLAALVFGAVALATFEIGRRSGTRTATTRWFSRA